MPQLTEYDPNTLKRVVNHDAARRQKELDAALARLNPQTTQVQQPGSVAPVPPIDRTNQPVDPTTALEPTIIEIPDPPPAPPAATQPPPVPATAPAAPAAPAVPTPEDWAKLEKRRKDAEAALTPFMQRSAALQKELIEERETTKSRLESLEKSIANLVQTLQTQAAPKPPAYNPDTDPELDAVDPMIATRLRRMNSSFDQRIADVERRHREELQAIRDQDAKRAQEFAVSQASSYEQTWNETFTKLVPDYMRFTGDHPDAFALSEWARRMPLEYGRGIANPKAHSPHFVAKIIDEFKATLAPAVATRQPSLGDLANAQLGGVAPVEVKAPEVINPLSEYEVRNAYAIVDKMYKDAVSLKGEAREARLNEANNFMDRYKRQMST